MRSTWRLAASAAQVTAGRLHEPALVGLRQGVADARASASGSGIPQIILGSPAAHDPQANGS
eukprot:10143703-Alexandrium_andersonii.AAC.1